MFRRIRIAVLLYVLLFVAVGSYLARSRATDWDQTLWVDVYPVNADGSATAAHVIDALGRDGFARLETFFAHEAARYGIGLARPVRFALAPPLGRPLPEIPADGAWLDAVVWSLRMRWLVTGLDFTSDRPTPDIVLFAAFHDPKETPRIERSTGLRKGLIAIANVFAAPAMQGSNEVVMAHELLHTLGATDKYDPATNAPKFPIGYAEPGRKPPLPQSKAEIMAGRIPIAPGEATMPRSLAEVVVGGATAIEIGWRKPEG